MTRKEVKQFLPIMRAFAEGKDIQLKLFNGERNFLYILGETPIIFLNISE